MKESNLKIAKTIVRLFTAASFLLFTAYQVFLLIQITTQREGRLIGIVFYAFLTAASFLSLIHKRGFRILRSVLFVSGMIALFVVRLFSAPRTFEALDFSNMASVLNVAVYVASQLGTLIFVFYYLAIRTNKKIKNKRKITMVLMTAVIALYALSLILECVMILKYRMYIDLSRKFTVIGRLLYFFGFAGTAVNFMLPSSRGKSSTEEYINKEQNDAEVLVSSEKKDKPRSDKDKKRNPVLDDANIVFSTTKSRGSHSKKHRR